MQLSQLCRLRPSQTTRATRARSPWADTTQPTRYKHPEHSLRHLDLAEDRFACAAGSLSVVTCDCPLKCPQTTLTERRNPH
jgi:hypothetical protein